MAKDNQSDSDAFVTEVCWHYYINEMTQAEIAERLGISQMHVSRLLGRTLERLRALLATDADEHPVRTEPPAG